ncbi:MAG: electron transport complex subunit E [Bacillota bacterium]
MKANNVYTQDLSRGIIRENPVFRLLLGMCPVLGVTAFLINGLGMGLAATAVIIASNVVIASLKNYIPAQVRIPIFIVIIATFVTIAEMVLQAFQPALYEALGVFIPLIVVNCMILGRAEAFASKRPVLRSFMDGLGVGIGFTLALGILALVREVLGQGTLLGPDPGSEIHLFGSGFEPMGIFGQPPGAFIALGLLLAIVNVVFKKYNLF